MRFLIRLTVSPIPYPGYRGCFVTHFSTIEAANFISLAIFDTCEWYISIRSLKRLPPWSGSDLNVFECITIVYVAVCL